MTPERLQEIRDRNQRDADWTRTGRDRRELLEYIDAMTRVNTCKEGV